jgi:succinate dehydrogenase / fumarate reductase iron-sulfur subunit
MLFTAAKVAHLGLLPQGQVEREERVLNMVAQMDSEEFGACSNTGSCSVSCPKDISLVNIAMMNREYLSASLQKYDSKNSLGDG